MRKTQVLTIVSIALISFFVGTLFNMNLVALGNGDGSPWDRIWTAITGLEARTTSIEEKIGNTTKIFTLVEMTVAVADLNFNGLSIERVHKYSVNNDSLLHQTTEHIYPVIELTNIGIWTKATYEYLRIELPLDVFVSNETVSLTIHGLTWEAPGDEYCTVTILNEAGGLVGSFTLIVPPFRHESQTVTIPSSDFFP